MAQPHVPSGEVVSVRPLGAALAQTRTRALLKAEQLEVVRIVLPAGTTLREHQTSGEITVQCIEGRIEFTTPAGVQTMVAGDFIHLRGGEAHALRAVEDASALVTICLLPRR
ncbi:MAG: cupin domain-containing protein [Hylemonella sp.]|uniref:cupin domain-containing protein n=1 Tax=Hylemonella sp. TaxID=2066020 RepID=UPI0022CC24F4|nr:cupin domain-containing protein [Hylemonella sp.]MCZ8254017.1 cupin domain-containing protein [Hylemonella sp.]